MWQERSRTLGAHSPLAGGQRPQAAGHLSDRTLVPAGGSRGTKTDTWSTTQAWCFPLKEAAWKCVAPMLKARTNHASAALNGEVYAIGGRATLSTSPQGYILLIRAPTTPLCRLGASQSCNSSTPAPRWPQGRQGCCSHCCPRELPVSLGCIGDMPRPLARLGIRTTPGLCHLLPGHHGGRLRP